MSLWADIDTYVEAQLLAELGAGGLYTDLLIKSVYVDEMMNYDDVSKLPDLPAVLVRSYHAVQAPGAHGGGRVNVENTYDYIVVAATMTTGVRQAKRDVQELRRRLREFLRTRLSLGGLTADDGETVQRTLWGASRLEVWKSDAVPGTFLGITGIDFKVLSI